MRETLQLRTSQVSGNDRRPGVKIKALRFKASEPGKGMEMIKPLLGKFAKAPKNDLKV